MQGLGFEVFTQHGIDPLLPLDAIQSIECRADNERLEMATIATDGKVFACKAGTNPVLDLLGKQHWI